MGAIPRHGVNIQTMESNMRHTIQGAALVVAVGMQMLTFYSVLFA